jgi:uncharacterized protein YbjQ (UPF0145 family)
LRIGYGDSGTLRARCDRLIRLVPRIRSETACEIAFLSAVTSLQSRAQSIGGDAIVDVKSITKHNDLTSVSEYRCAAGGVVANVVLTGRVVKLK